MSYRYRKSDFRAWVDKHAKDKDQTYAGLMAYGGRLYVTRIRGSGWEITDKRGRLLLDPSVRPMSKRAALYLATELIMETPVLGEMAADWHMGGTRKNPTKRRPLYPKTPERHYAELLRVAMKLTTGRFAAGGYMAAVRNGAGPAARDAVSTESDEEVIVALGSMRPRDPQAATIAGARRQLAAILRWDVIFALTGRT